jgi:hypothetical protein
MSDKQAQQDALRAQRAYESYEREWRRKEKEAVEKQVRQEQDLRLERIKQQRAREIQIALESKKLKQEFFDSLEKQKEMEKKYAEEEKQKIERNRRYALELQQQIRQKEEEKRKGREEFFMEGVRMGQERLEKKKKIDAIKERKLEVIIVNLGIKTNGSSR